MGRPPNCSCQCEGVGHQNMVVIGHERVTVNADTDNPVEGTLTALDYDGNHLWTVDLGEDTETGRTKFASDIVINDNGDVYVSWIIPQHLSTSLILGDDNSTDGTSGGLVKLDKDGELLWEITFPAKNELYAANFAFNIVARNALALRSDGSLWCGTCWDENDKFIHIMSADGDILASYGNAETWKPLTDAGYGGSTAYRFWNGQCHSIAVDSNDECWLVNTGNGAVTGNSYCFRINDNGEVTKRLTTRTGEPGKVGFVFFQHLMLANDNTLIVAGPNSGNFSGSDFLMSADVSGAGITDASFNWSVYPDEIDGGLDFFIDTLTRIQFFDLVGDNGYIFCHHSGITTYTLSGFGGAVFTNHFMVASNGDYRYNQQSNIGHEMRDFGRLAYDSEGSSLFRLNKTVSQDVLSGGSIRFNTTAGSPNLTTLPINHDLKIGDEIVLVFPNDIPPLVSGAKYYIVGGEGGRAFQVSFTPDGAPLVPTVGVGGYAGNWRRLNVPCVQRTNKDTGDRIWDSRLGVGRDVTWRAVAIGANSWSNT